MQLSIGDTVTTSRNDVNVCNIIAVRDAKYGDKDGEYVICTPSESLVKLLICDCTDGKVKVIVFEKYLSGRENILDLL